MRNSVKVYWLGFLQWHTLLSCCKIRFSNTCVLVVVFACVPSIQKAWIFVVSSVATSVNRFVDISPPRDR